MSHSNIYPFPNSSLVSSPSSTIAPRRRVRSRTLSLLPANSGISKGSTGPESPKAEPTTWTSNSFLSHIACGSFVPNTPAAAALRTFLPTTVAHVRGRSRYSSLHLEKELETPPSPSSAVPFITRTLPLSSDSRSPSPSEELRGAEWCRRLILAACTQFLLVLSGDLNFASGKVPVRRANGLGATSLNAGSVVTVGVRESAGLTAAKNIFAEIGLLDFRAEITTAYS
ncbi:hypothetical protein D9756_004722 [Leucocoprinus leucothites]|uniref:Uncharacterized protein n=1 Tax=Leucocoprinus leucothites TaxID=201217 RepID=A0A8H5G9R4_9AGAR|nr:hypothetical protein D9756_004722 [Leucoagaricus leucothites]